jgi:hypothetical protein
MNLSSVHLLRLAISRSLTQCVLCCACVQLGLAGWDKDEQSKALSECGPCIKVGCQCKSPSEHEDRKLAGDIEILTKLVSSKLSLGEDSYIIFRNMDNMLVHSHTTSTSVMNFLAESETSGTNLFGRCMKCKGPPVTGKLFRCGSCSKTLGTCCAGAEGIYSESTCTMKCPLCDEITISHPTVRFMCIGLSINKVPLLSQQFEMRGSKDAYPVTCLNNSDTAASSMKVELLRVCEFCGTAGVKLKCICCLGFFYCNTTCQKKDWKIHKGICMAKGKNLFKISFTDWAREQAAARTGNTPLPTIQNHALFERLGLDTQEQTVECILAMNRADAHVERRSFKYANINSTQAAAETQPMNKDQERIFALLLQKGMASVSFSYAESGPKIARHADDLMKKKDSRFD